MDLGYRIDIAIWFFGRVVFLSWRISVVRKANGYVGWFINIPLRNPKKTMSFSTLLSIKNQEIDNVVFGLRKDTLNHQPSSPNALRTTKKTANGSNATRAGRTVSSELAFGSISRAELGSGEAVPPRVLRQSVDTPTSRRNERPRKSARAPQTWQ